MRSDRIFGYMRFWFSTVDVPWKYHSRHARSLVPDLRPAGISLCSLVPDLRPASFPTSDPPTPLALSLLVSLCFRLSHPPSLPCRDHADGSSSVGIMLMGIGKEEKSTSIHSRTSSEARKCKSFSHFPILDFSHFLPIEDPPEALPPSEGLAPGNRTLTTAEKKCEKCEELIDEFQKVVTENMKRIEKVTPRN
ncbi:hypothetical protein ACLOJK_009044 [Asimina triloba]